jgi:uncharacterized membrane protein
MIRRHSSIRARIFPFFVVALVVFFVAEPVWSEEKEKDNRPERGMSIYSEYSAISVPPGETVRLDLTIDNKGKREEDVLLKIAKSPQGWKTSLKSGIFGVTGVPVAGGKTRILTFTAEPEKSVKPGMYEFQIDAQSADGKLKSSQNISVTVRKKAPVSAAIQLTTAYPIMRGPSDTKFEFSLDVNNKSDSEKTFNLSAHGPEQWEINFKPSYEQKLISSLRMKADETKTVAVEITPLKDAKAGTYPITVQVSAGDMKAETKLTIVLTGTYKLDAGTPSGVLSLDALAGKPANMSFYVKNTGSAANRNISFTSFKPENWKVEFKPDKLEALEPGQLKQIEVTITPAAQALVGDYSVGLSVDGEKGSSKTLEMRVSVKTSAAWGWIGIVIIVVVIGGLSVLFIVLGRR